MGSSRNIREKACTETRVTVHWPRYKPNREYARIAAQAVREVLGQKARVTDSNT